MRQGVIDRSFVDIPRSVEYCEMRVSVLPLLHTGHRTVPYMGFYR
jgi:hypothetical protein